MDAKIKKLFEKSETKYTLSDHKKVYTAFTEAETQHINPKEVVKAVLVKLDKPIAFLEEPGDVIEKFKFLLVAVPAGKRVDFKKINKLVLDTQTKLYKKLVKAHPKLPKPIKVKSGMAKEKDITTLFKTKVGLIAPLPNYNLPIFMDKKLVANKNLIMSAGSYTESLVLKTSDYLKLANPILGNFTES
jgi:prolyl-tRNA editing enzyme YbaK/EbsC (Cys-tRNA(Pro) deacylase)